MAKSNETDLTAINLVGAGTVINGDINSNGDIRIDGTITGQLRCKGKVVVGNTGVLEGELFCQNADVSGKIKGKIEVKELCSMKSSSRVFGDIVTSKLAIEPGAIFTGTCSMDKGHQQVEDSSYKNKVMEK